MKILKILKIVCIILILAGAGYLLLLKGGEGNTNKSPNTQEEVSGETPKTELSFSDLGSYEYEDETLIIDASLPIDEEGEFVDEVYEYGVTQIEQFQKSRNEIQDLPDTASFPWSLDLDYKKYESQAIISYVVQSYEYTGGAHGNAVVRSFNYSKDTGKLLSILDIIEDEDSLNVFAALADKELTIEYPEGSSGIPENWSVWFAHDDSVTFIFPPYQIAPFAVGQQEFTIATGGDNQDLFKEKYFSDIPE